MCICAHDKTPPGFFFYKSGTQELDIEYLSDPTSKSNPGDGSKPMHYTNQPAAPNSVQIAPSPSDATTAPHEYRIDWIPGKAMYYLDGVLQKTITVNVPSVGGTWLWNNWAYVDSPICSFFFSPSVLRVRNADDDQL